MTLKVRAGANTTFRARFAGDYRYGAVSSARSVHVRTHVGLKMSGYTRTSGGYYHYASNPLMTVGVAPARAGGCAHMAVQVYSGGTWRTVATMSCLHLDGASKGYAQFVNSHPVGVRYRVHASVGGNASPPPTRVRGGTSPSAERGLYAHGRDKHRVVRGRGGPASDGERRKESRDGATPRRETRRATAADAR